MFYSIKLISTLSIVDDEKIRADINIKVSSRYLYIIFLFFADMGLLFTFNIEKWREKKNKRKRKNFAGHFFFSFLKQKKKTEKRIVRYFEVLFYSKSINPYQRKASALT